MIVSYVRYDYYLRLVLWIGRIVAATGIVRLQSYRTYDLRSWIGSLVTARVHLKSPMQTRSKAGNLAKEKDGAKDPVATLRAERAEFFLVCTRTCELWHS